MEESKRYWQRRYRRAYARMRAARGPARPVARRSFERISQWYTGACIECCLWDEGKW